MRIAWACQCSRLSICLALIGALGFSSLFAQTGSESEIDNARIVQMSKLGLGDDIIVARIKTGACKFSVSDDDRADLKRARVSDKVVAAMLTLTETRRLPFGARPSAKATRTRWLSRIAPVQNASGDSSARLEFDGGRQPAAALVPLPVATQTGTPKAAEEPPTVLVKSTPDGADITVDGKYVGITPSTLRLPRGDHVVKIEKAGFKSWQRSTAVESGASLTIASTVEGPQKQ